MRILRPNPRREMLEDTAKMRASAVVPGSGQATDVTVTHKPHLCEAAVPTGRQAPWNDLQSLT